MNDTGDPDVDELEQLRRENADLKRRLQFFLVEHRFIGRFTGLILFGPRLTRSIHNWLLRATLSNPLPVEETSALLAAVARRLTAVGLFGLVFPGGLLLWQNCLIQDQNRYFREQTKELRRQIAIQEEQGDFARRKELLEAIYDGEDLSIRTRVEAVKALVQLDNKLLDQGILAGDRVDLRGVDLSCIDAASRKCADFTGAWLVRTDFSGSKFVGANFMGADLRDSYFLSTDLSSADFSFAFLQGAQFRDRLFTPSFRSFGLRYPWMSGLSPAAFKELEGIITEEDLGLKDRNDLIWSEFTLERMSVSDELRDGINRRTNAAVITDAKLLARSFWHLDQYTRLPLGVVASKNIVEGVDYIEPGREDLERLDSIQSEADKLFGRYKVNIQLGYRPALNSKSLACLNRGQWSNSRGRGLDDYAKLTPKEKETFIRELCTTDRRFRIRSLLPFPDM